MRSLLNRCGAFLLCLLTLLALCIPAAAAEPSRVSVELRPSVTIIVDGVKRTFFNAKGREVHAIYREDIQTHYLPIRAIGELIGYDVNWDGSTQTISLTSPRTMPATTGTPDTSARDAKITVQIRPDFSVVVNGTRMSFTNAKGQAVYPLFYDGSNYLPLRAIGELMNKTVSWNAQTRTITLTSTSPIVTDADTFGPTQTPSKPQQPAIISEASAKSAALSNAGLNASQVAYTKCQLEWEDGVQVYEIEFYHTSNYQSYEYEIDAKTGAVRSMTFQTAGTAQSGGSVYIGEEKARTIALSRVPGAPADSIRELKLECDDGRWEYEIELVFKNTEYEFTLDAYTGAVLKWSSELIY